MAPSYAAVRKSVKFDPLEEKKWKKIAVIVNFDGDYTLGKRYVFRFFTHKFVRNLFFSYFF